MSAENWNDARLPRRPTATPSSPLHGSRQSNLTEGRAVRSHWLRGRAAAGGGQRDQRHDRDRNPARIHASTVDPAHRPCLSYACYGEQR